ncbi:cytochrome c-type biogenesis protein [Henriciella litoralis]|uniref:cytochrome c-type biogenesis protein n=1 Tax=Henriciella litoralis TaxID=568102 RepID=UPI000A063B7C|nr:cytochrome c-type biogenesis protein [Henriciella litoralis]
MKFILAALLVMFAAEGQLADPKDEARAQDLMREIRCVACENEPISNSGSDIAADMRERVRAMVAEGQSDAEIRSWFAERYGDFVLFRPPSRGIGGFILWGLPFLLLVAGGLFGFFMVARGRRSDRGIEPVAPEDASVPSSD